MEDLKERLATATTTALAVSANFYPEDTPKGFIEITLAVPEGAAFGAGLFELRFLRLLTPEERATRNGPYAALSHRPKEATDD